jgi:hypothetical protein
MEFIIIAVVSVVLAIILAIVFEINIKKIKEIADNKELDKIASKLPENKEICEAVLKKLNNEDVKIEENNEKESCLYIAISNKILIANLKDNFTRIQTICHECLHSVQSKKLQYFNFAFSNVYLLYFIVVLILAVVKVLPLKMMFLTIFVLFGLVYYAVRVFLENDAMMNAKYLAKEYMEESNLITLEETNMLVNGFEQINALGIKGTNFSLALGILVKTAILSIIFAIFV